MLYGNYINHSYIAEIRLSSDCFIYLFVIFLSIANIFALKFSLTLIHLSLIMLLRGREVNSGSGAVLVLDHREGEKKRGRDGGIYL